MGHPDELDLELSDLHLLAWLHHSEVGLLVQVVFLELFLHEAQGERGPVDGRVQIPEHIGERTDMVFVAVGEQDGAHLLLALHEVADIRDHHVDAEHVRFRKHEAAVHDDDVIAVLEGRHVQADLAETAQCHELEAGASCTGYFQWVSLLVLPKCGCKRRPVQRPCCSARICAIRASHFRIQDCPGALIPAIA